MASGAISAEIKKITDLRVVDLKTELKRRNLDVTGVKNVLIARLKQVNSLKLKTTPNLKLMLALHKPRCELVRCNEVVN